MKKLIFTSLLLMTSISSAFANSGGLAIDADRILGLERNEKLSPQILKHVNIGHYIKPSKVFKNASHVINGVALRNRTDGTIALRGVPLKSKVLSAILYWNYSDASVKGRDSAPILINGNRVNGKKTADNGSLCWSSNAGNHTYKANVTDYLPRTRPNNDYVVTAQFNEETSTTGQNPWNPVESQNVRVNGAWLVVIYATKYTTTDVFIYDSLSNTDFSGTLSLNLIHDPKFGAGLFSMGGVDGQRGSGHTDFASNETSWFNLVQFAGPPVAASDWDGSDGLPLPQLSDTHTHHVELENTVSNIKYISNGDCLAPTVFVIEG